MNEKILNILSSNPKSYIFFDVDGVLGDYEFEEIINSNYSYESKRPIKTTIKLLEKLNTMYPKRVYIYSVCSSKENANEKKTWLKKNVSFFPEEQICVLLSLTSCVRDEILKFEIIDKLKISEKIEQVVIVDDSHAILKFFKINYGANVFCVHISSLII